MIELRAQKKGEINLVEKLAKLHNTLSLIETKGENTKIMAQCLQFIEGMIAEEQVKPAQDSSGPAE